MYVTVGIVIYVTVGKVRFYGTNNTYNILFHTMQKFFINWLNNVQTWEGESNVGFYLASEISIDLSIY